MGSLRVDNSGLLGWHESARMLVGFSSALSGWPPPQTWAPILSINSEDKQKSVDLAKAMVKGYKILIRSFSFSFCAGPSLGKRLRKALRVTRV